MNNDKSSIFRKSSTTYFFSSIFFPKIVRDRVFTLYAFVRKADDYVDQMPQDKDGFYNFKNLTISSLGSSVRSGDPIIDDLLILSQEVGFEAQWIVDFLTSMESDLYTDRYPTYQELNKYMYGSADVIGLMMARIMDLPKESYESAMRLGHSMQLINFIRDIQEDLELGRVYMPQDELHSFGLSRKFENAMQERERFADFVRFQVERYMKIVAEAEKGFMYIPKRLRVSVMTANDMYRWTAEQIAQDPQIIFRTKVKPTPAFVIMRYIRNYIPTLFT